MSGSLANVARTRVHTEARAHSRSILIHWRPYLRLSRAIDQPLARTVSSSLSLFCSSTTSPRRRLIPHRGMDLIGAELTSLNAINHQLVKKEVGEELRFIGANRCKLIRRTFFNPPPLREVLFFAPHSSRPVVQYPSSFIKTQTTC